MTIYFADTNVFLRYVLHDIPEQSKTIENFFGMAKEGTIKIVITSVVFTELIYTSLKYYELTKEQVVDLAGRILATPFFDFEEEIELKVALAHWSAGNLDFVDCYLKSRAEKVLGKVLTFDKKLARI